MAYTEVKRAQLNAELTLSPANARVVLVGQFDPAHIKEVLDHLRGGIPVAREILKPDLPLSLEAFAPSEIQLIAMPVRIHDATDTAALRLAASLIGEELEKSFRGAGVGYSCLSEVELTPWMDALWVILPAHDPSGLNLKPYLIGAIDRVRNGKITPERFELHRQIVARQLEAINAEPVSLARAVNEAHGLPWVDSEVGAALAQLTRKTFDLRMADALQPDRGLYVRFSPARVPVYVHGDGSTRSAR